MARLERSPRRIAIHEAGHAVMVFLCGRRLGAASAIGHDEILGELEYRGFVAFPERALDNARERRKLEQEIMIALAGLASESLHRGPINVAGGAVDLQRALDFALAAIADPEEATVYVNWLFVRARNILRDRRCMRAIKLLSAELVRRGSLRGSEMRALLHRSLG